MNKSELSAAEVARRENFVTTLSAAGWNCSEWEEMFAAGFDLSPDAYCERLLSERLVGLGYRTHADAVTLRLESGSGEQVILHLYPAGYAEDLAVQLSTYLVELAGSGSSGQLLALVERMSPLCRQIELETSEGFINIE